MCKMGIIIPNAIVAGRRMVGKSFDTSLNFPKGFKCSLFILSPGEVFFLSQQYTIRLAAEDSHQTSSDEHPATICMCVCVYIFLYIYIYIYKSCKYLMIRSIFIVELMSLSFRAPDHFQRPQERPSKCNHVIIYFYKFCNSKIF